MARGRPRKTAPEEVLDKAMAVFWERGFDGTSMNDLVEETGMAKPGLYANFGDKEQLYQRAMTFYFENYGRESLSYLEEGPDNLEVTLRTYLEEIANFVSAPENPGGCFFVNGVVDCANKPASLEDVTQKLNAKRLQAFRNRFKRAKEAGELPASADEVALSDFFSAQPIALGVMARAKQPFSMLQNLIEIALTTLPK